MSAVDLFHHIAERVTDTPEEIARIVRLQYPSFRLSHVPGLGPTAPKNNGMKVVSRFAPWSPDDGNSRAHNNMIRDGSDKLLAKLWAEHPQILAHLGATQ